MGKFLHKIGENLFEKRWWVVSIWLVIILSLAVTACHYYRPVSGAISIPGTKAQIAIDRLSELFPDIGRGSGKIVFHSDNNINDYKSEITNITDKIKKIEGVTGAISPFDNPAQVSDDGKTAYTQVQLKEGFGKFDKNTINAIETTINEQEIDNLEIERDGGLINQMPSDIIGLSEVIGLLIALVVLSITLKSLKAAGLPILNSFLGVGVGVAGLFSLSQMIDINSVTPALAIMLGLAVGIDYSLFIISKYRNLLSAGYDSKKAAGKAIGTAGNAVIFAASTVIIALAALSVMQIPFLTVMGLSAAATVFLAALISITLTPALLGFFGKRFFGHQMQKQIISTQKTDDTALQKNNQRKFWHKWGEKIIKHPYIAIIISLAIVAAIGWPATQLQLGLSTDQYASENTTQRRAYNLISESFGVGYNAPLTIIADNLPEVTDSDRQNFRNSLMDKYNKEVAEQTVIQQKQLAAEAAQSITIAEKLALQEKIAQMEEAGKKQQEEALKQIDSAVAQYSKFYQLSKVAESIAKVDNVKNATAAMVTDNGKTGLIQVIPKSSPSNQKTSDLISYIRNNQKTASGDEDVTLLITGTTALQDDINQKLSNILPIYLAIIIGLSLILLVFAFRSILIPIKATLGFLLSVFAMFGSIVAVFQLGFFGLASPAPIISFIPIIIIGILFGLAMDYEFFLVSGMHESYTHVKDNKKAIVNGFNLGAQVVVAAAIIMAVVFLGFFGNSNNIVKSIGFGLAVGIMVDAFIVRLTILPAVMAIIGKSVWWLPKWLDKILPHVSIEGEESKKE
jgi:RND superfamily putative drug exporter